MDFKYSVPEIDDNFQGFSVIPLYTIENGRCTCGNPACGSPGKHPVIPNWKEYQTRKPTAEELARWKKQFLGCNWAVVTGEISGVVVLDVDGPEGVESIKGKHLPLTWTVKTGKGIHYYFRWPGFSVQNGVRVLPGVDIRGDGGYVVAPGSIHGSGKKYAWVSGMSPEDMPDGPAPCPEWLLELPRERQSFSDTKKRLNPIQVLAGVLEGQRDETLFRYACRLKTQGLTKEEALRLVLDAAKNCTPPFPEREAARKVESAWRYETGFHLTDLGNAKRLVSQYGQDIRYCHVWGKWLVWNGRYWEKDDTGAVLRLAKETVRGIYAEAAEEPDEKTRKALAAHAQKSESALRIRAMVSLAESEPGIPVTPAELDADPWLLNVLNGTIDLRTGGLRPHRREDLITKLAPVEYDPAAECPTWIAFIDKIFQGNKNLIIFIQKALGYALTGDTREQVIFFLYGTGANGKSTLIDVIMSLLGDYALQTPSDTLLQGDRGGVPNDVARLRGARFVAAVEAGEGRRMNEVSIKRLTGRDIVTARFLHQEFFEFKPQCKIFIAANHKPTIKGTDHGIWRRIRLVPFQVTIPDDEQDKCLPDKLKAELPGILAWLVRGCVGWQELGLGVPDEVKLATEGYRAEMDVIAGFIEDCCQVAPHASVQAGAVYEAYREWCINNGEEAQTQRKFGAALTERGFQRERGTGGRYFWRGIGLGDVPKYSSRAAKLKTS